MLTQAVLRMQPESSNVLSFHSREGLSGPRNASRSFARFFFRKDKASSGKIRWTDLKSQSHASNTMEKGRLKVMEMEKLSPDPRGSGVKEGERTIHSFAVSLLEQERMPLLFQSLT